MALCLFWLTKWKIVTKHRATGYNVKCVLVVVFERTREKKNSSEETIKTNEQENIHEIYERAFKSNNNNQCVLYVTMTPYEPKHLYNINTICIQWKSRTTLR